MSARRIKAILIIGLAALTPLVAAGTASADNPPPVHLGDPALWGPPLEALCDNPDLARRAGYNVIEGNNDPNVISGGPAADAIYGYGGNDTLFGASGDDVVCAGQGHDEARGEQGNDAVFGEAHNDTLTGDKGRDFVDGGSQTDDCYGGRGSDAGANCETVTSIP